MTVTAKCLLEAKFAEAVDTTQYTVGTATRTIIDKCSAYNSDTVAQTITVNLVPSGGTAATSNVKLVKNLAAGETYTCPEIVGQVLNAGDFVSTKAGTASKVVIRLSGREIT